MFKLDYRNFGNDLKVGLVFALLLLIILFYLFPVFPRKVGIKRTDVDVKIYVQDIPRTEQIRKQPVRSRQKMLSLAIPVPVEKEELPEELILDFNQVKIGVKGDVPGYAKNVEIQAKPLLEIYPEVKSMKCDGQVKILMLVNEKGVVVQAEVVENTTGSPACAEAARAAALKSKWIPAKVGNKFVTSWVEKVYKFKLN